MRKVIKRRGAGGMKNTSGVTVTQVAQCDLCKGEIKYKVQPNQIIRTVVCGLCGKTAAVGPPPPNNLFTRCPYCMSLLTHAVDATTLVCPSVKCGKRIDVSRGPTRSVPCDVCRFPLTVTGQRCVAVCSNCGESTVVGPVPNGKIAVRCICHALLIVDCNLTMINCPRENCGRMLKITTSEGSRRDSPNTVTSNHIQLYREKCIGQGSFGTVYKACCVRVQCAAKLFNIPPPTGDRQTARASVPTVIQTVQPLCALSHASLVKYIGVSSDPTTDFPVIAMELMRGNITRFLEQLTEPTPLCVQLDFSHDLAQALFYLQEKGIIHGNLSGTNVLLSEEGSVKVSDFEVLSLYPQVTVQQMGPKTLPYMPPEAFSVPPFRTEKVDSFSWGVLALQIITQLFPNPGARVQTVTHPQSLARPLEMPVSEVSRRKSHIDLVNHSNPLLSVLVLCLDDIGERRPTMAEVCNIISLIKSSPDYKASQQQAGADWSKRHLFVMEYEPVSAVESSQQLNVRVHSQHQVHVEETGSRLNKLSLESEDMGGGESNGDVQHLVGVKNNGSNTDCGSTEEENDEDLNEPVKGKFTESEGTINGTPEPSAPSLQVDSELEATATAALPSLPPYSSIPSSQYAYSCPQPPEGQCATGDASPYEVPVSPPPYTLVPADHPQQPLPSAPPHNLVGPLQGVGDQPNVQTQGGLHDFHCAVCKHKSKYRQLPGQRISNVRCSKCKECTPVGAPAEKGKVYGRCAFCNCLMVYPSTAKRLTCPRQKCKEVIFTYTTTGKMMRRAPCEACHYVMQMVQDPDNISASTLHICSQCGEANFIGSAPPGFGYTRCPYCNVLIKHNSASLRVTCPRSTCQKVVEVGDGTKRSVKCDVCAKTVIYYGDRRVATCGHCGKSTVVGTPPPGKAYFRCICNTLLVYDECKSFVKCPMKECEKVNAVSSPLLKIAKKLLGHN